MLSSLYSEAMNNALSSNHFSTDIQTEDAMEWLRITHPAEYRGILQEFPEYETRVMSGAWWDTDEMGVDFEWGSWLTDAVEATGLVFWEEGEPFALTRDEEGSPTF